MTTKKGAQQSGIHARTQEYVELQIHPHFVTQVDHSYSLHQAANQTFRKNRTNHNRGQRRSRMWQSHRAAPQASPLVYTAREKDLRQGLRCLRCGPSHAPDPGSPILSGAPTLSPAPHPVATGRGRDAHDGVTAGTRSRTRIPGGGGGQAAQGGSQPAAPQRGGGGGQGDPSQPSANRRPTAAGKRPVQAGSPGLSTPSKPKRVRREAGANMASRAPAQGCHHPAAARGLFALRFTRATTIQNRRKQFNLFRSYMLCIQGRA